MVFERLCSVVLPVPPGKLEEARETYSAVFGPPELQSPGQFYAFNINGFELRLAASNTTPGNGPIAYWHVDNMELALTELTKYGRIKHHSPPVDDPKPTNPKHDKVPRRASVSDEYNNLLGVITNPAFPISDINAPLHDIAKDGHQQ